MGFIVTALPQTLLWAGSQCQASWASRLSGSWHVCSEQLRDDVVAVDTIDQPFPVVVDKPAGDLGADADILPVVFLGAPGKKERDTVMQCGPDGC